MRIAENHNPRSRRVVLLVILEAILVPQWLELRQVDIYVVGAIAYPSHTTLSTCRWLESFGHPVSKMGDGTTSSLHARESLQRH